MVSLTLMARLLEALRPDARLVLVGDPDQLASVEAGAVLGDLVAAAGLPNRPCTPPCSRWTNRPPSSTGWSPWTAPGASAGPSPPWPTPSAPATPTPRCTCSAPAARTWSSSNPRRPLPRPARRDPPDPARGHRSRRTRRRGHRPERPAGPPAALRPPHRPVRRRPVDRRGRPLAGHRRPLRPGPGPAPADHRQRLQAGLYNGDTGVVVDTPRGPPRRLRPRRRDRPHPPVAACPKPRPVYAMTVHRSQGSQFDRVSLILPPATSPLLTRELFYTAVTRARSGLRIRAPRRRYGRR